MISKIDNLIETLKLSAEKDLVYVYDFKAHAQRLFKSALELSFSLPLQNRNINEQILRLQNIIKNELQYFFKASVDYSKSITEENSKKDDIFKLNIFFKSSGELDIKISPYTKELQKIWRIKLLDKNEFQVKKDDNNFNYKFYPRLDFSKYLSPNTDYDEVLWTNEKDEISEGSFTNIFFQDYEDKYYTPSLESNLLSGIARELFIKKFNVTERVIYRNEIKNFKKVFLTNSIIGIHEAVFASRTWTPHDDN